VERTSPMTDYKALCAELVRIANALDGGAPLVGNQGQALDGYSALAAFRDVATRARAALAEPEPEGPSDEELLQEWDLVPGARVYEEDAVDFARAVLARWGNL
jgi:hypothetical protein